MAYKFEDDSNESLQSMLDAVKPKPKVKKEVDPNRLEWLKVEIGQGLDFRVVKVCDQTFHKAKQHFLGGIDIDGVIVPPNTQYAPCTETDKCIGEHIHSYIKEAKSHTEFKSEENRKLFSMMNSVEAADTLFVVGIDRRDNKLKIFQCPKLVGQALLEKAMSKKYGNPAHPTKGYDWKFVRAAKNKWDASPYDDSLPLTKEELKLISETTFSWDHIRSKYTQEAQDKLGIKFGTRDASNTSEVASEPVKPVEMPSDVTSTVDTENDIPF